MKNTYTLILAAVLFLNFNLFAQNGTEKSFVTSLPYHVNASILVDLDGTVEVSEWKENYIRVVIEITTNLESEGTLDMLMRNNRYYVYSELNQYQTVTVSNPFGKREITVNGKPLKENIRYKILVPSNSIVQVLTQETEMVAQVNSGNE